MMEMLIREMLPVKIENLKLLNPVQMNASSRPECLPDTRQDLLKSMADWLTTPSPDQNIFWLHGLAGSGKSTISTTLAEYFRELGRLGAFLFFDRNNMSSSEPAAVVPTLCYKLASFDPTIRAAVCAQIEHDPSITEASLRVQFTKLLHEPLSSLAVLYNAGPVIIVLDAFDECGNASSRRDLLALLTHDLAKFPPAFRFLITSRREPDIDAAFSCCSNIVTKELNIMNDANVSDISSYFHHHLSSFHGHPTFQLVSDWPGKEKIEALTQYSAGLFIWASTAIKFIAEGIHPDQQLDILLHPHPSEAESALNELYSIALHTSGNWDWNKFATDFRAVLGVIITAREPVSDITIDHVLGLDGPRSSTFILSRLHCLIQWTQGQVAKPLHASFADYLTDAHRSGSQPWFIDVSVHHELLALGCFRIMKAELKFNICNLETSYVSNNNICDLNDQIQNHIPLYLRYACRFWADHLQETKFISTTLSDVNDFLSYQLLFWLEVLSIVKEVHIASPALLSTANWAQVNTSTKHFTSGWPKCSTNGAFPE
jgi:NACHT domain